jgi:hypothetical protein
LIFAGLCVPVILLMARRIDTIELEQLDDF